MWPTTVDLQISGPYFRRENVLGSLLTKDVCWNEHKIECNTKKYIQQYQNQKTIVPAFAMATMTFLNYCFFSFYCFVKTFFRYGYYFFNSPMYYISIQFISIVFKVVMSQGQRPTKNLYRLFIKTPSLCYKIFNYL